MQILARGARAYISSCRDERDAFSPTGQHAHCTFRGVSGLQQFPWRETRCETGIRRIYHRTKLGFHGEAEADIMPCGNLTYALSLECCQNVRPCNFHMRPRRKHDLPYAKTKTAYTCRIRSRQLYSDLPDMYILPPLPLTKSYTAPMCTNVSQAILVPNVCPHFTAIFGGAV